MAFLNEFLTTLCMVKKSVRQATPAKQLPYEIKTVQAVVEAQTSIDKIILRKVNIDNNNHLLGEYTRYERRESAYQDICTTAEIYYATHLNTCWTRFIVCKEICHAMLDGNDGRANTIEKVAELLEYKVQSEGAKRYLSKVSVQTEELAEWAALEILCPVEDRRLILDKIQNGESITELQIATEFRIPIKFIETLFEEKFVSYVEDLLSEID